MLIMSGWASYCQSHGLLPCKRILVHFQHPYLISLVMGIHYIQPQWQTSYTLCSYYCLWNNANTVCNHPWETINASMHNKLPADQTVVTIYVPKCIPLYCLLCITCVSLAFVLTGSTLLMFSLRRCHWILMPLLHTAQYKRENPLKGWFLLMSLTMSSSSSSAISE